jgi:hypothetical protein
VPPKYSDQAVIIEIDRILLVRLWLAGWQLLTMLSLLFSLGGPLLGNKRWCLASLRLAKFSAARQNGWLLQADNALEFASI